MTASWAELSTAVLRLHSSQCSVICGLNSGGAGTFEKAALGSCSMALALWMSARSLKVCPAAAVPPLSAEACSGTDTGQLDVLRTLDDSNLSISTR